MQIKELAEIMGFQVLHGIVDCLWVVGEPISSSKEAVETETCVLTEVDSYDWIAFAPMSDGSGAYKRYREGLQNADARELAIHRRVSRLNYSRRCAEASAVQAHLKRGIALAPGMEIGYVVRDAKTWSVDTEKDASGFDEVYYRKLLDRVWAEVAFCIQSKLYMVAHTTPA